MSRLKSNRDSGFLNKIRTIRLIRDGWTLCKGFGGGGAGACSTGKKYINLRSSNCWKYIEIVNPTITTLFLYHFKSFTIPSGRTFGSWGVACAPRASPLPTGLIIYTAQTMEFSINYDACFNLQNCKGLIQSVEETGLILREIRDLEDQVSVFLIIYQHRHVGKTALIELTKVQESRTVVKDRIYGAVTQDNARKETKPYEKSTVA